MTANPEVITFGCRLNVYESEVIRQHALAADLRDVVIINTCTVTAEAERQARQTIRRLRRENPARRILVTGCAAQIDPDKFSRMPEVDGVIGNDKKLLAETFLRLKELPVNVRNIQENRVSTAPIVQGFEGLERAFVQVQNGCDHRCTFCVIPLGRGPSRSVPVGRIIEQVKALVDQGYREIVFTGVDIASYGPDLNAEALHFGTMVRQVLWAVPELKRLRLSSLDPAAVDEDLWRALEEEPRLMPHWHLSLQAGDDLILKRMKRRHNRATIKSLTERARRVRSDIVFGADVIVGFPTEDDQHFANTVDLIKECAITWLHVFPYSARTGTPAARMPQVHGSVRKARAFELRAVGTEAAQKYCLSLLGTEQQVLVEQQGLGCTPHFAKLKLKGEAPVGEIVAVRCERDALGAVVARVL